MDKAVNSRFDLNGDGAVDLKDLAYAAKVAGVTVSAVAAMHLVTFSASRSSNAVPQFAPTGVMTFHASG